jgi:hypothetical protein
MNAAVALATQHHQVLLSICSRLTSVHDVVDLELIAPAAMLAFPAIPLQDFDLQLAVFRRPEPHAAHGMASFPRHADFLISRRNSSCCDTGRKP